MSRSPRVYVTQYGYWWSFTVEEWLEIARGVAEGGEQYNLPESHRIKRRPRRHNVTVLQPLDWGREEFADHVATIEAGEGVVEM